MLPDGRRLGAHLQVGEGMVKAVDRAVEIGATAIQIFGDNPTAWTRRAEPQPDRAAFRDRLSEHGIAPLVVHASYLINLAGPDDAFFGKSVALLAAELRDAPGIGARYVNIHTGSHRGTGVERGIERLVDGIVAAIEAAADPTDPADPPTILLENASGGGWGLGVTIAELEAIAQAIERRGIPADRVGFCLDTAHAWGAGYDLSDPAAIDALLLEVDARLGLNRLPVIHLNDSKSALGSRMDRHEHVGAGHIGEVGMAHLLRHPMLAHAAYILETPGMDEGYDAINLARAVALARGEPLEPLPPGALTLRRRRSKATGLDEPAVAARER
jgi:deoxyribonuclease-4